jgi:hypothetical protein
MHHPPALPANQHNPPGYLILRSEHQVVEAVFPTQLFAEKSGFGMAKTIEHKQELVKGCKRLFVVRHRCWLGVRDSGKSLE